MSTGYYDLVLSCIDTRVTNEDNAFLLSPFTVDEYKVAIMQMHPDKSPGPNGFNPTFFQSFWDLIGSKVFASCVSSLDNFAFPATPNSTNVILIPKCDNPSNMRDLWLIVLCNVIYKILAKVLANQLKVILPRIIAQSPSAFVPGRSIVDNLLVAFELIQYMKKKKGDHVVRLLIKIDISKFYDRID